MARCFDIGDTHGSFRLLFQVDLLSTKIPAPEQSQMRGCRLSSSEHGLRESSPGDQEPGRIRLMAILTIIHVHRVTSVHGSPDESYGQVGLLASGSIYLPRLPIPVWNSG